MLIYTVREVAKILKTNPTFVYRLINTGQLKAMRIGSWKVCEEAIKEYLERCERNGGEAVSVSGNRITAN